MIQRKQTIWLLIASVCSFLTIKFPFYSGNVVDATTQIKTYTLLTAQQPSLLIFILTICIAVASLAIVFLYKSRPKQLLFCGALILLSIVNTILYFLQTKHFVDGTYSLTSIFSILIPIFIIMAAIGINNDEKLIKSADKLR